MNKELFEKMTAEKDDFRVNSIKKYYLYSLIPLIIGIVWFGVSFLAINHLQKQVNNLRVESRKLDDTIRIKKEFLSSIKYARDSLQAAFFFNHDSTAFKNTIEADSSLREFLKYNSIDKTLIIKYYKKTADQDRVWAACKELGYSYMVKKATKDTDLAKVKTNAIYFNSEVKLTDLKIVALVLIRAGFGLKTIENDKVGQNTIEIGSELDKVGNGKFAPPNRPVLTVKKIIQAKTISDIIYK